MEAVVIPLVGMAAISLATVSYVTLAAGIPEWAMPPHPRPHPAMFFPDGPLPDYLEAPDLHVERAQPLTAEQDVHVLFWSLVQARCGNDWSKVCQHAFDVASEVILPVLGNAFLDRPLEERKVELKQRCNSALEGDEDDRHAFLLHVDALLDTVEDGTQLAELQIELHQSATKLGDLQQGEGSLHAWVQGLMGEP